MKHSILTCLFLAVVLVSMAQETIKQPKALSYEEALRMVIENNETLKQSAIKIEQKEEEAKAKLGLYLPKISLSANYVMMTDVMSLDLTPIKETITPLYDALGNYGSFSGVPNPDPTTQTVMPILPDDYSTAAVRQKLLDGKATIEAADWNKTIQEQYFGMVSANFVLPLYTGGKIRIANKAAKIDVEEATAESRQKLGEVTMDLVERYYGLLLAQKVEVVRDDVMKTMQKHMNDAEKMKNEGLISNTEFLQTKVYYTEAKREKDKAKRQISIVNDALLNTLTIKDPTNIVVLSSFFYHTKLDSLDYFKALSHKNSPLLEQIRHKQALAEQQIHLKKSNYLPNAAAMGTYTLAEQDLSPYIPAGMIGVGLTWSLFEGNSRNKELKSAELQQDQVDLYYNKSKSNIETMITKYYNEAAMHLEQIKQLEVSKEFAQDYYNACEKSFKEGLTTSSDVSDANLLVAKMKIEQLQATYNYDVNLSKLLYYVGTPEEFGKYLNAGTTIQ